jgi:nitrous oxidase accessory protein NosD
VKKIFGHQQKIFLVTAVIAVWAGLSAQPTMAATVYVGTCVANVTRYATIQAAVNAVKPGSTIRVCPGNYSEQVVINKDLTLTGYQSGSTQNPVLVMPSGGFVANATGLTSSRAIAAQILVQSPATDVTISYLAVEGTGSNLNSGCFEPPLIGIYYQGASGTLDAVVARNQAQDLSNFGCSGSAVTIQNSTVRGYQKSGIVANEAGTRELSF